MPVLPDSSSCLTNILSFIINKFQGRDLFRIIHFSMIANNQGSPIEARAWHAAARASENGDLNA